MTTPAIVWFRHDLRLEDNSALIEAGKLGKPIIPVFIWAPEEEGAWRPGAASKVWLHYSLKSFSESLAGRGLKLILRKGKTLAALKALIEETGADCLYWNRRYEPEIIERDALIKAELSKTLREVKSFNGSLLFEPWEILNGKKAPYQVYSAFERACRKRGEIRLPEKAPKEMISPRSVPKSLSLTDLDLLPSRNWVQGIINFWTPGEEGARTKLKQFLKRNIFEYQETRNRPDIFGTSRLSPYLHFGEISPHTVWHAVEKCFGKDSGDGIITYQKELLWREFAYHLLYHFPTTPERPLKKTFDHFPWKRNQRLLRLWQKGETGYPIVDAGMRELWTTGWMHNRVRMIVASFLVKDLLIPWQEGARWFWDTLVDADLSNNTLGWQWTAGCGADAAPYFRVFNPVLQGEKFDPDGSYVRKWIPELSSLSSKWIHKPWEAPEQELQNASVIIGKVYPAPIVDHREAKELALSSYDEMRSC